MEEKIKRLSTKITDSAFEITTKLTNSTLSAVKNSSLGNLSSTFRGVANNKFKIGQYVIDIRDYEKYEGHSTIIYDVNDIIYQCIHECEDVLIGYITEKRRNMELIVATLTEKIQTYHESIIAATPNNMIEDDVNFAEHTYSTGMISQFRFCVRYLLKYRVDNCLKILENTCQLNMNENSTLSLMMTELASCLKALYMINITFTISQDLPSTERYTYLIPLPTSQNQSQKKGVCISVCNKCGSPQIAKSIYYFSMLNKSEQVYENNEGFQIRQIEISNIENMDTLEVLGDVNIVKTLETLSLRFVWIIFSATLNQLLYLSLSSCNCSIPPANGWLPCGFGKIPAPTLEVREIEITGSIATKSVDAPILFNQQAQEGGRDRSSFLQEKRIRFLQRKHEVMNPEYLDDDIVESEGVSMLETKVLSMAWGEVVSIVDGEFLKKAEILNLCREELCCENLYYDQLTTQTDSSLALPLKEFNSKCAHVKRRLGKKLRFECDPAFCVDNDFEDDTSDCLSILDASSAEDDEIMLRSSLHNENNEVLSEQFMDMWSLESMMSRLELLPPSIQPLNSSNVDAIKIGHFETPPSVCARRFDMMLENVEEVKYTEDELSSNSESDNDDYFHPFDNNTADADNHTTVLLEEMGLTLDRDSRAPVPVTFSSDIPVEMMDFIECSCASTLQEQKQRRKAKIEVLGLEMWPPKSTAAQDAFTQQNLHYVIRLSLCDANYIKPFGRKFSLNDNECIEYQYQYHGEDSDHISNILRKAKINYFERSNFSVETRTIFTIRKQLHEICSLHGDLVTILQATNQLEIIPPPFPDVYNIGIVQEEYLQSICGSNALIMSGQEKLREKEAPEYINHKLLVPPAIQHLNRGSIKGHKCPEKVSLKESIKNDLTMGIASTLLPVAMDGIMKSLKPSYPDQFHKLQPAFDMLEQYIQGVFELLESLNEDSGDSEEDLKLSKSVNEVIGRFIVSSGEKNSKPIHYSHDEGSGLSIQLLHIRPSASSWYHKAKGLKMHYIVEDCFGGKLSLRSNEELLRGQRWKCAGCDEPLSSGIFGLDNNYLRCHYTDAMYCKRWCHGEDKMVVPHRLLNHWDFRRHGICTAAVEYLESVMHIPVLPLKRINPLLYEGVKNLQYVNYYRKHSLELLEECLRNGQHTRACTAMNAVLGWKLYLCLEDDLYSLQDLLSANELEYASRSPSSLTSIVSSLVECLQQVAMIAVMGDFEPDGRKAVSGTVRDGKYNSTGKFATLQCHDNEV